MARASFGGSISDYVIAASAGSSLRLAAATLTMWSAETGGIRYDDLVLNGAPATTIPVTDDGQIPTFQGPDEVLVMWTSADGGPRVMIDASGDIAIRAGAAADRAEDAATAAEAVGASTDAQVGSSLATRGLPTTGAALSASYVGLFKGDDTGLVDSGPALQAAFDANPVVHLRPGTYYINTPIFLDSTNLSIHYRLVCHGAVLKFGPNLPSASGLSGLTGTKWAFFNNTLRSALSGGVVTTTSGTSATAGVNTSYPRFVIDGGGTFDANGNIVGLVWGNLAGTHIKDFRLLNMQCGISWNGYVDGNHVEDGQTSGTSPTGSANSTRLIYQRDSGDQTAIVRCKAYGGYLFDAAGCRGFQVDSCVAGQVTLINSKGTFIAPHLETDEISGLPWSVRLDRSEVTALGGVTYAPKAATKGVFVIADTADAYVGSRLSFIDHTDVFYMRPSSPADATDTPRGPLVLISSMNAASRILSRGMRSVVWNAWGTSGYNSEGTLLTSTDTDIQAALDAAADAFSDDFELRKVDGQWRVVRPSRGLGAEVSYTAPTLAVAASTTAPGSLTNAQSYQYVAAIKSPDGGYTPLSSAVAVAAGSQGTIRLTLSGLSAPCTVALWRVAGTGVTTAPDRYIEIPVQDSTAQWWDTGSRVNGRAWATSSLPVPNTVASSAATISTHGGPAGALAWTFDRNTVFTVSTGAFPASGTGVLTLIHHRGGWVTGINWRSGATAASSPTHAWAAIKSRSGKVLAVTADQTTTAIPATTTMAWAVTAPVYLPRGDYYVELMVTATTTMPTIVISGGGSAQLASIAPILAGNDPTTGRTTPPSIGAVESMPSSGTGLVPYIWLT